MDKKETRKGECKYCHSMRIVNAPGDLSQEELDQLASQECDCKGAQNARRRAEALRSAYEYGKNLFDKSDETLDLFKAGVKAVESCEVSKLSFKRGKYTYTVEKNKDGEIKATSTYTDTDTMEF